MKIRFTTLPKNKPLFFEYGFYPSNFGTLLLVSWEKNMVALSLVAKRQEALQVLKKRFPQANFRKQETPLHKQVLRYLARPKSFTGTFAVAHHGTAFQGTVWQELGRIPFGKIAFYGDVAKKVGRPSAVRAVASAVAKNPLAILIPCHRVLPRGGGIGNYHWGSKKKKALLTWERLA